MKGSKPSENATSGSSFNCCSSSSVDDVEVVPQLFEVVGVGGGRVKVAELFDLVAEERYGLVHGDLRPPAR